MEKLSAHLKGIKQHRNTGIAVVSRKDFFAC